MESAGLSIAALLTGLMAMGPSLAQPLELAATIEMPGVKGRIALRGRPEGPAPVHGGARQGHGRSPRHRRQSAPAQPERVQGAAGPGVSAAGESALRRQ